MVASPEPSRGARLRTLLVGLLLVPAVLLGLLLTWVVSDQVDQVRTADEAVQALVVDDQIVAAQSAVLDEVIPTFAPIFVTRSPLLDDPAIAGAVDTGLRLLGFNEDQIAGLRERTDRAVDAIGVSEQRRQQIRQSVGTIRSIAALSDSNIGDVFGGFSGASERLRELQDDQRALLSVSGLPPQVAREVQARFLISQYVAGAQLERALRLGVEVVDDEDLRDLWLESYGAMTSLAGQIDRSLSGELLQTWRDARADPSVVRRESASLDYLQRGLTPVADPSAEVIASLTGALADVNRANAAFEVLLQESSAQVSALVEDQRSLALTRLWVVILGAAGTLLLIAAVTWYLLRSITRPLADLADEAQRISEGDLDHVEVGGPREVQTVSRALDSAVSTLRQVQNQAEALGKGELGAEVLSSGVPGPLGMVMHESIQAAVTMAKERDQLQRRMLHLATHDTLTGLPNRTEFLVRLQQALGRAERSGLVLGLLFVDLDHFKKVNDTFGHGAGDDVLKEVAARLTRVVRAGDTVARLGGDEFVCIIEPVDSQDELEQMAQRLVAELGHPVEVFGRSVTVGSSVGVTLSQGASVSAGDLLGEADAAVNRAKSSGRGAVHVFDASLREELQAMAVLEEDLKAGIANGELVAHFQPVLDLGTMQVSSFEALTRWDVPGRGLVPPNDFIPVAERSTLITELGRWVLREAAQQLVNWQVAGFEVSVGVNISGRHFASPRFVADVREALESTGAPPERFVIELTETVVVDDESAHESLRKLQGMGVRIALDDFGTGFTSIGQLERLPVDILKIDRGFIASSEPATRALVELMIRSAHAYGLQVVAEGIEEPEQADWLRALGCDQAQGFLFCRPMPATEVVTEVTMPTASRAGDRPVRVR